MTLSPAFSTALRTLALSRFMMKMCTRQGVFIPRFYGVFFASRLFCLGFEIKKACGDLKGAYGVIGSVI